MDTHFQKLAQMVAKDPALNKQIPDLLALYDRVIQKLEKNPAVVSIQSPMTRENIDVKIGPFGLNMVLRFDIGDASDLPVFPRLLYEIDQGNYDALQWFVQKRYRNVLGVQGMSATMDLASGASPARRKLIEQQRATGRFADIVNITLDIYDQLDGVWPDPDLGEKFRQPLTTDLPILLMSGTLDFNTPPYQAEELRWGLANAQHIIVQNAGHEQVLTHPDAIPNMLKFLKGESLGSLSLAHPPLKFIPLEGKEGSVWHPSLGER